MKVKTRNSTSINDIEQKTEKLLLETGQEGAFPVSLGKIVNYLGFTVQVFDSKNNKESFEDVSGMIDKQNMVIYINNEEPSYRKRFTLAHEIGHSVLGHEAVKDYRSNVWSNDPEEIEADLFAANLLMPKKEFVRWYAKLNTSELAAYFGVSRRAIGIRADQLFDNYV